MSTAPDRQSVLASLLKALETARDSVTVSIQYGRGGSITFHVPEAITGRLHPCLEDIVEVLRVAGERRTTEQIKDALQAANKLHGDRTVGEYLSRGVKDGVLTKDARANPPGYGLVEW